MELRQARPNIMYSMLQATAKKVAGTNVPSPELQRFLLERLPPLPRIDLPYANPEEVTNCAAAFENVIKEGMETVVPQLPQEQGKHAHYFLTKLRERLKAVLLRIHPISDTEFVVKHDKTDSVVLQSRPSLTAKLSLGAEESGLISNAYSGNVEADQSSDTTESIDHPYDPAKTKIDTRPITVDLLVRRITHQEVDLSPAFQRKAGLWTQKQKSQLIESILIRIPLPSFYFDATDDSRWLVVDGLQRLGAFNDFICGGMPLDGLEYLAQYNGKQFSELPRPLRRAIEESQVTVHLIQPGTPPEVKFNIFRRVNTGGLVLTPQEIRHALNQGAAPQMLLDLARSPEFLTTTAGSIPIDRMADREFVLRFLAFTITPYTEYRSADMDAFLSVQMGRLNKMKARFPELSRRFTSAMALAHSIFGKHAFRKQYSHTQARSPINKALFETWSVHLGALTEAEANALTEKRIAVIDRTIALNYTDDFDKSISQGTADVARVRRRFSMVGDLIQGVLNESSNAE